MQLFEPVQFELEFKLIVDYFFVYLNNAIVVWTNVFKTSLDI